jgi:hypothetical protein
MIELTAPPQSIQYKEMRKSFYAGVHWFLETLSTQLDPDAEPTADDLEYMQRIFAELVQFNEDVKHGRA